MVFKSIPTGNKKVDDKQFSFKLIALTVIIAITTLGNIHLFLNNKEAYIEHFSPKEDVTTTIKTVSNQTDLLSIKIGH